ncbi:MFS transporter [Tepiditoga spiralis]|uniref:MFS transporter n=1 Tax=Tepiditoga spiralis TaxID=2108365 RepID=A0A7G1G8Z3_9BACT|nr:MFS transporter [Tepiditoga spiralis]BBE31714.1 MFS transporter [Tepiditoga spiralis]
MNKNVKRYLFMSSIPAFSFITILISPMFANKLGLSVYEAGMVFSIVYGVQSILTFLIGKLFEKRSPNYGITIGRTLFGIGNLVLAYSFNFKLYLFAQILIGSFDMFFPLLSMYERAIISPKNRNKFYTLLPIISEGVKAVLFIPMLFFIDYDKTPITFYRTVFLIVFLLNLVYSLFMLKVFPKVKNGNELTKSHSLNHNPNKRKYLTVLLNQILFFSNFGFGSYLIISYYVKESLNGDTKIMLIYEIIFSLIVLSSIFWRKHIKMNAEKTLIIGTFIMSFFYFLLMFKSWTTFFLSHAVLAIGFTLWISAKEPLKQEYAPKEFGRWEGFFNGIQIFSKIFTPILAGFIASKFSYSMVFLISFLVLLSNTVITLFGFKYKGRVL